MNSVVPYTEPSHGQTSVFRQTTAGQFGTLDVTPVVIQDMKSAEGLYGATITDGP